MILRPTDLHNRNMLHMNAEIYQNISLQENMLNCDTRKRNKKIYRFSYFRFHLKDCNYVCDPRNIGVVLIIAENVVLMLTRCFTLC